MTMHLQRCLSLPRSPNPLLPQRMCLALLQLLPTHMCKFCYSFHFTDPMEYANIYAIYLSIYLFLTLICNFTEKVLKPVHFVTVWSGVCTASENSDTSDRPLSGSPLSHQHLHRLSQGTMTCLPLDFLTPPVWQHCLMIQVKLQPVLYY